MGGVTALMAVLCVAGGGCIGASLATDSGPGTPWSTDNRQMVYVGEHVDFSFVILKGLIRPRPRDPSGAVDYCIATAGTERIEPDLDAHTGHYRFGFDVLGLQPGQKVNVSVAAYRRHGVRDIQKVDDTWVQANDPFDQDDGVITSDSLTLTVYRTQVELPVDRDDLDMAGGRLELHRNDGKVAVLFHKTPTRRGFSVSEPDSHGVMKVIYAPTADQINKTATTYVKFRVLDSAGQEHVYDGQIPTP